jgi:hypothetical protein
VAQKERTQLQGQEAAATAFFRRLAVVANGRTHPDRPEFVVRTGQARIRELRGQVVDPQQPAKRVVTLRIPLARIGTHQFRRQVRSQPLESAGKLSKVMQGQEEDEQPLDGR